MNMKEEMSELIDNYLAWVKDHTKLKNVDDKWIKITTPYLDRHNDCLQIYAKKEDHNFRLTDDGHTLSDLMMSGCTFENPERQSLFKTILAGFGVELEGEELFVHASVEDFPLKKHNLVQAMLSVNNLFFWPHPHVDKAIES